PPRRLAHGVGPFVRNPVREDRDLRLDPGLVEPPDDLHDAPDREAVLGRVLHDLDLHDVARLRAVALAPRDQHLGPALALLEHVVDAPLRAEQPDERRLAPLEDVDDPALAPSGPVAADPHGDTVAVP